MDSHGSTLKCRMCLCNLYTVEHLVIVQGVIRCTFSLFNLFCCYGHSIFTTPCNQMHKTFYKKHYVFRKNLTHLLFVINILNSLRQPDPLLRFIFLQNDHKHFCARHENGTVTWISDHSVSYDLFFPLFSVFDVHQMVDGLQESGRGKNV